METLPDRVPVENYPRCPKKMLPDSALVLRAASTEACCVFHSCRDVDSPACPVPFLVLTRTAEELSVTTTTTAATTAASNDAIINNYVTSVDSLITETVPLNVVIESTTET